MMRRALFIGCAALISACPQLIVSNDEACATNEDCAGICYLGVCTAADPVVPPTTRSGLLASGDRHVCAETVEGLTCWGTGEFGVLGRGSDHSATGQGLVATSMTFPLTGLALGAKHSCAIDATHELYCWGHNNQGQIDPSNRDGRDTADTPLFASLGDMTKVALGDETSCAIAADNLYCWGDPAHGLLGDGAEGRPPSEK